VNYDIRKYPERWQRFCDYTYNQIEELTSRYGKLDILWLDGGWVCPQNGQDINMPRIASMARNNQHDLLIVDRTVTGKYENYRTPEQQVPDTPPDYPWETCMTMATSWSYVPGDIYKPANQLIHLLVEIVAKGGNFLLNIGPSPEGEFADTAYSRLREIGDWMKVNREAIYGTRPFKPYQSGNICFTGLPDGTVYLIYLASDGENRIPSSIIIRNWQPSAGSSITLLGKHGKLRWNKSGDGSVILIPSSVQSDPPCKNAWVLKIAK
jgi:alpha-L-fucosidase